MNQKLVCGNAQLINSRITQEKFGRTFCALMSSQRRSCNEKEKCCQCPNYIGSEFDLKTPSKNRQKMYIYHCCMLYLTDPGAPGTFQTWRPPKSLISPSSGELSPLQYCTRSEVIRCRCSFHKLIIALYDCFKYNTRRQSHFLIYVRAE